MKYLKSVGIIIKNIIFIEKYVKMFTFFQKKNYGHYFYTNFLKYVSTEGNSEKIKF